MAEFAQIQNRTVVNTIAVSEKKFTTEEEGAAFCASLIQSDKNEWMLSVLEGKPVKNKKAGIGDTIEKGNFIPRKPYPSWVREGLGWKAPKEFPGEGYVWNEENLVWVELKH